MMGARASCENLSRHASKATTDLLCTYFADVAQADELTLSGRDTADDWTPSYSWHGFRYIEVTVPHGMKVGPEEPGAVECYPMRTDVDIVANFTSSDPFLSDLRTLNRNTFDSNLMSVQSDCPHRERFGYGGDPLGCGEAGLSIYDWSTFYAKRVRDFNDAQSVDPTTGKLAAFTETSPFVGIRCGGCGADGGFKGDLPAFPHAGGPIGWQTYQPVTQLWLYKYYGDKQTMADSFDQTYAYIQMLEESESDPESTSIESGLGDWMPVQGTSTAFTGRGFQRMSYLAFANITEILGKPTLAKAYRSKAAAVASAINAKFLNKTTGAVSTAAIRCATQMQTGADSADQSIKLRHDSDGLFWRSILTEVACACSTLHRTRGRRTIVRVARRRLRRSKHRRQVRGWRCLKASCRRTCGPRRLRSWLRMRGLLSGSCRGRAPSTPNRTRRLVGPDRT